MAKSTRTPFALKSIRPGLRLNDEDAQPPADFEKEATKQATEPYVAQIATLQERLYAEGQRAVLVILQGMDTSGKDGAIRSVFADVNPIGMQITSFVRPSEEELDHDFLWRIYQKLPRFGNIGVFNRSQYEDVLVVRVRKLVSEKIWRARYEQINQFEALISSMGIRVLKFYLHISRAEQKERLEARLADKAKHYKFRLGDLDDRAMWNDFQSAYVDALTSCHTEVAPWHIVPADKKWFRNWVIAKTVAESMEQMDPRAPKLSFDPKQVRVPR